MVPMLNESRDTYEILSRYYDLEFDAFDADLEMYRQFAETTNGPVLELGCGSGRVLAGLTDLGLPLTGVDTSPAMLELARARLGPDVTLVERDMRRLQGLEGSPFWFAFCAINTFLHLPDVESQLLTLNGLRDVVVSGGILMLDVFTPQPDYLLSLDGRIEYEFKSEMEDGTRIDKWAARSHDLASQTIETTVFVDATSPSGEVTRLVDGYSTRYIHLFELEHLLARTQWEIISIFGDYDLQPFDSGSERIIVLATTSAGAPG